MTPAPGICAWTVVAITNPVPATASAARARAPGLFRPSLLIGASWLLRVPSAPVRRLGSGEIPIQPSRARAAVERLGLLPVTCLREGGAVQRADRRRRELGADQHGRV